MYPSSDEMNAILESFVKAALVVGVSIAAFCLSTLFRTTPERPEDIRGVRAASARDRFFTSAREIKATPVEPRSSQQNKVSSTKKL